MRLLHEFRHVSGIKFHEDIETEKRRELGVIKHGQGIVMGLNENERFYHAFFLFKVFLIESENESESLQSIGQNLHAETRLNLNRKKRRTYNEILMHFF